MPNLYPARFRSSRPQSPRTNSGSLPPRVCSSPTLGPAWAVGTPTVCPETVRPGCLSLELSPMELRQSIVGSRKKKHDN